MIAALFEPLIAKLIAGAIVAAALGIGGVSFAVHYENKGYAKAIHAIAAKDERAIEHVSAAKKKVDECFNAGRNWNTSRGLCD